MVGNPLVRVGSLDDLETVLELNQNEVKWTSDLSVADLKKLVAFATLFLVAEVENQVSGFLIAVPEDSAYSNSNLRWFRARYANFWYIDRIVVLKSSSGLGLGRRLYEKCFTAALENGIGKIVCEYSTVPMNEGSAAFHRNMGFAEVGARKDVAQGKEVSMQMSTLESRGAQQSAPADARTSRR